MNPPRKVDAMEDIGSPIPPSASLQSVAVRFQERALQLEREKKILENTQHNLDILLEAETKQKREHSKFRQEFLRARFERDTTEGEVLALRQRSHDLREEILELRQEIDALNTKNGESSESNILSKLETSQMIPHRARQQLFLQYLRGRVNAVEQKDNNREEKRKKLRELIVILRTQCDEIEEKKLALKAETKEKQEAMERETAATTAISEKVRGALAERQQLRDDLRRAKKDSDDDEF